MTCPNFFVVTCSGDILLEKHWSPGFKNTVVQSFLEETLSFESKSDIPPVIVTPKYYFVHLYLHELYFLTVTNRETPPLLLLDLQHLFVAHMVKYLGQAPNVANLRDNFFAIYELLDEMVDGGCPLTTEINILTDMVEPPSMVDRAIQYISEKTTVSEKCPAGLTSRTPWRKVDASYVNNEVFFDVIEHVDAILDSHENILAASVFGQVQASCCLSGMPDLLLTFSKSSVLDDVLLHRCVRINRFERERVISFVPPDGNFTLLSYRMDGATQVPISVQPRITCVGTSGRVQIKVFPRYNDKKPVEDVVLTIPLPSCTISSTLTSNYGSVKYNDVTKTCVWEIGRLPESGGQPTLEGGFEVSASYAHDEVTVISATFLVKMFCLSGLKVDGLTISNVKYKPFKGVRCLTKAGTFQIRCT